MTHKILQDRTIMVAGGTGNVGRYVVNALLGEGAQVVVPSRSEQKIAELRSFVDPKTSARLLTLAGNIGDAASAERVRDDIMHLVDRLDGVVATLGRMVPAPSILRVPVSDLMASLDGYLVGHFVVARTYIPLLSPEASYTFINGPLAYNPLFPGTGLVSIATAAQAMLTRVIIKELQPVGPRVNEVVLYTSFGWGDKARGSAAVSQQEVGTYVAYLASWQAAQIRGQTIHLNSREALEHLTH